MKPTVFLIMEIWKGIEGYEGLYQISNLGRVKSFKNSRWGVSIGKIMKTWKKKGGYLQVQLYNNGRKLYTIHRLVAVAFIPNNDKSLVVMHKSEELIDGILDNSLNNIKWGTRSENSIDMINKSRNINSYFKLNNPMKGKTGGEHNCSKKVNQYTVDGTFIKTWDSLMDIERELGIRNQNISGCCRGIKNTSGGFIWKYN